MEHKWSQSKIEEGWRLIEEVRTRMDVEWQNGKIEGMGGVRARGCVHGRLEGGREREKRKLQAKSGRGRGS